MQHFQRRRLPQPCGAGRRVLGEELSVGEQVCCTQREQLHCFGRGVEVVEMVGGCERVIVQGAEGRGGWIFLFFLNRE